MADQLTDLPGIGPKTAESLRNKGISTPTDLADAYERNSPKVLNAGQRVQQAAREAAFNRGGGFVDPMSGARVTEENRTAFEKIATKRAKDFNSVSVSGSNSSVSPDDEVRSFISDVKEGTFLTQTGGDTSLLGFAADATENLGADSLSSGELQDLNFAAQTADEEVTLRKQGAGNTTTPFGTANIGALFRATARHQQRSPMAKRVDGNRKAPTTTDYEEWAADPSEHDFKGVDTPMSGGDVFPEKRTKRKRGGFGSSERKNRDREKLETAFDRLNSLTDEAQERLFGATASADVPFSTSSGDDSGGFEDLL